MSKEKKVNKKSWLAKWWQKIKRGTSTTNIHKKKATAICQAGKVKLTETKF